MIFPGSNCIACAPEITAMAGKLILCAMVLFCTFLASTGIDVYDDSVAGLKLRREKLDNQTVEFEKAVKNLVKSGVKRLLPTLMSYNSNGNSSLSSKCMNSLMKYIAGLTSVKVWALRMLDATSKPPAGIFEGTLSDFGAFDECLEVVLPLRNGSTDFTGKYCTIEARPVLLPIAKNFSVARQRHAGPLDTIGREVYYSGAVFFHSKFRLGVCVPSKCSVEDIRLIADKVSEVINMEVKVPQCYVKEGPKFLWIHIVTICVLALLLMACIGGSVIDYKIRESDDKRVSTVQNVFLCFSLISNSSRLFSASKGSEELKALHGLRAISMTWVILGHTYVWTNYQLTRRPSEVEKWFTAFEFGAVLNGWMAVETFFFLSGLLTCYAAMRFLPKTKGRINIPIYILRRYIRFTPPLLVVIGLLYFLPVISSGPFWYDMVDPELRACAKYWWTSIIYISNWTGIKDICVQTTWYLSADFQLYAISVVVLYILYRYPKLGISLIAISIALCNITIGVITYIWELHPTVLPSTANHQEIERILTYVHIRTFTHVGPYFIGMLLGFLISQHKAVKIGKLMHIGGWCISIILCISSLYGAHRWNIGYFHGPLVTSLYAALHRTTFIIGVAWVTFTCVTGNAGIINKILSSPIFAPFSRLTFMQYLLHSLVIWVRIGSLRERSFTSHYNQLYEYLGNLIVTCMLAIPFYLLLEAPLSNLERLFFSRAHKDTNKETTNHVTENGHHPVIVSIALPKKQEQEIAIANPVALTSVKKIQADSDEIPQKRDSC